MGSGGAEKYSGRSMLDTHRGMYISPQDTWPRWTTF
jgi:hypothetical protein